MMTHIYDDETRKVWLGEFSRRLPNQIQQLARRKLRMLNNRLAKEIGVTEARISAICSGKRAITADTANGLSEVLAKIHRYEQVHA